MTKNFVLERFRSKSLVVTAHFTAGASGLIAIVNRAPHPNAARVFLNWLASKEGAEVFSRAQLHATTRTDVDESFLPPDTVPQRGVKYFDSYDWEFTLSTKEKVRNLLAKLLKR